MIHSRMASQARPKMPACSTGSSTTSGTSTTGAPDAVRTLIVPTRWPFASGATSGSVRSTLVVTASGAPVLDVPLVVLETVEQAGIFGRAWDALRLWIK